MSYCDWMSWIKLLTYCRPALQWVIGKFVQKFSKHFQSSDIKLIGDVAYWTNIHIDCEKISKVFHSKFKFLHIQAKLLKLDMQSGKPAIEIDGIEVIVTPSEETSSPPVNLTDRNEFLQHLLNQYGTTISLICRDIFLGFKDHNRENIEEIIFVGLKIDSVNFEGHAAKKMKDCTANEFDISITGMTLFNFLSPKSATQKCSNLVAEVKGSIKSSLCIYNEEIPKYSLRFSCESLVMRVSPIHLNLLMNVIKRIEDIFKPDQIKNTYSSETCNEVHECQIRKYNLIVEFGFIELVIAILYKNPSDKNASDPLRLDDKHSALKFFSMLRDAPVSQHGHILDSYDCEEDEDHFLIFTRNLQGKLKDFPEKNSHYQNIEFSASRIHISESLSTIPSGRNKKKHEIFEVPAKESSDEKKFELSIENNGPSLKIKCSSPGLQVGLDLSLMERLQHLFEICAPGKTTKQITPVKSSTPIKYIVASVTIPYALIQLWFPVPTFEQVETINVLNQGFRDDYLSLELHELNLKVQIEEKNSPDKPLVIMKVKNIHGLFHESIGGDTSSILHLKDTECVLWTPPKSSVFEGYNDLINGPLCHGVQQHFGLKLCPEIPVGKARMTKFLNEHARSSIHYLTIKSNGLSLYLPSKNILEILYNRLLSDLVLWQPQKSRLSTNLEPDLSIKDKTTSLSLEMQISSVSIFARTPYRNHLGVVVPDTNGEILIRMKDAKLVVLAEFLGDPNMFYTILEVPDSVSLEHNPKQEAPTQLLYPSFKIDEDSFKEVVTSDIKSMITDDDSHECDQALSVVIKMHFNPVLNLSSVKVIGQCDRLTIRHYMEMPSSGWVSQLTDLLSLEDYPVQGYILPNVRNECQFSCHRMQLDFIPELLPFAGRLVVSTAHVKVVAETSKLTVIDFLIRQLYIAMAQTKCVPSCRNYVGILKLGMFEARLDLTSKGLQRVYLKLYNTVLSVCADSCKASIDMLNYMVQGDSLNSAPCIKDVPTSEYKQCSKILDDHQERTQSNVEVIEPIKCLITLELSPEFYFYEGQDFVKQKITKSSAGVELDATQWLEVNNADQWFTNGGVGRQKSFLQLRFHDIRCSYTEFNRSHPTVSLLKLEAKSFCIEDHVKTSCVNTMVGSSKEAAIETEKSMFKLSMQKETSQMNSLQYAHIIELEQLPLDIAIDQDSVEFVERFMTKIFTESSVPSNVELKEVEPAQSALPTSSFFIKSFVIRSRTYIRFSYVAKRIPTWNYSSIETLVRWVASMDDCCISLKSIELVNVGSAELLFAELVDIWATDIRNNQTRAVLKGFEGVNIFMSFFKGLLDLILMPLLQYQTNGSVLTGIRNGTNAFAYSTTYSLLNMSGRLASGVQSVAEMLHELLSAKPQESKGFKKIHPPDSMGGLIDAYRIVTEGLEENVTNMMSAVGLNDPGRGVTAAVGGVLMQIPSSVVQPVIVFSEATQTVLGGIKNQLNPEDVQLARIKWKA